MKWYKNRFTRNINIGGGEKKLQILIFQMKKVMLKMVCNLKFIWGNVSTKNVKVRLGLFEISKGKLTLL